MSSTAIASSVTGVLVQPDTLGIPLTSTAEPTSVAEPA
jgi:hypothetical protein